MSSIRKIGLLGFGEVGALLAADLSAGSSAELSAYDSLFDDPQSKPAQAIERQPRVRRAASAVDAVSNCDLVISAVTAAQDVPAARSVSAGLQTAAVFLDLNSVAPRTKSAVAEIIKSAGGRYVEAAIMSPIAPQGIASPILAGGPHARDFIPLATGLGFTGMRHCSDTIGQASASKMCRSVIVKGVEALLMEALLAARHYGVEEDVISSLSDLFPRPDWARHARYMISRSVLHGIRRAEEMRQAAITVSDAGIEALMSGACASRQELAPRYAAALQQAELAPMLDAILASMQTQAVTGKTA